MKGLLWSDLHSYPFAQCSKIVNGVNDRIIDSVKVVHQVLEYYLTSKSEFCIFGGDFNHKRGELPATVLYLMYNLLEDYKAQHPQMFKHWYWLVGNHDQDALNPDIHSMSFLNSFGHVLADPTVCSLPHGYAFSAHPWRDDRMEWREGYLSVVGKEQKRITFSVAHTDFRDIIYRGKAIGEAPASSVTLSDRPTFSGHYHDFISGHPVTYIGSPLQHNWGDVGVERGILQITLEKDDAFGEVTKVTRLPIQAPKFVKLNSYKQFLNCLADESQEYFVTIDTKTIEEAKKEKIISKSKDSNIRHIQFYEEFVEVDTETVPEEVEVFNYSHNFEDLLAHYLVDVKTDLDKESLQDHGNRLLKDVL